MDFRFNPEKAILLKEERNIDLDEVVYLLLANKALDAIPNPTRENQIIFILEYREYIIAVPCVEEGDDQYFIKTAYPSRKLNKSYKNKED